MARGRDDDSDEEPVRRRGARWRKPAPEPDAPPPEEPEEAPDPDRLLRLRFVFAFVTALIGGFAILLVTAILSIIASGRVDLPVAAGALLVSIGTVLLVVRALLRALMARRPEADELRSLTGFVSLGTGLVLLGAVVVFLLLTLSVMLRGAGDAALFILPLLVLAFFTLQFTREATDDFLKRTRLRREGVLFLTSIAYFALTVLVAQLLFAASVVSPLALVSPPDGSIIAAGTPLDIAVTESGVTAVSYDAGEGPRALPAPWDIDTTGWPDGPYTVRVTASSADGSSATLTAHVTLDSTPPTITPLAAANNTSIPLGTVLRFSVADTHLSSVRYTDPMLDQGPGTLPAPYEIPTSGRPAGPTRFSISAQDAAGNWAFLEYVVHLT
jgi:hypothetical protein